MTLTEKREKTLGIFKREYLVFDAVYSDETPQFAKLGESGVSEFFIRTAKDDADEIFLRVTYGRKIKAEKDRDDGLFSYYRAKSEIRDRLSYHFELVKAGRTFYYNKRGIFPDCDENYDFTAIPSFKTPDWAKGCVYYQIYVDRFRNGDKSNDVVTNEYAYLRRSATRIEEWNSPVKPDDVANFYGGDLAGVREKLPYLKDLGIGAIYFNPIFVSPSNHKYDAQDYDHIDPHYGVIAKDGGETLKFERYLNRYATKYMKRTTDPANLAASDKYFADLVALCHENGIKVIIDGVFNHCGSFGRWLDREGFYLANGYPAGAYRDKNSPYASYFRWYDDAWPNNECYDGWWGHENHPKFYYEGSKELWDYILNVGKKWVSPPYNADGWRLDVAEDLGYSPETNHRFWQDFRAAVKEANPDAVILAEQYNDPSPWLKGDEWDTIMNYEAFMRPLTWFLTGMEIHSEEFRADMVNNAMAFEGAMRYHSARMPYQALYCAMNELSNHDHSRFLTRTNMTVGRLHTVGAAAADRNVKLSVMMEAVAFQMLWYGAPTIYYGDEAGMAGWTDPDDRRPFPWGRENKVMTDFHKELIKLRKNNPALKDGSLEYLYLTDGIISFGRWKEANKAALALNNNGAPRTINLPVWKLGAVNGEPFKAAVSSQNDTFTLNSTTYTTKDGCINLTLPSYSSITLTSQ